MQISGAMISCNSRKRFSNVILSFVSPNYFLPPIFTANCSLATFSRSSYWPPSPTQRSPLFKLPSGKKCFIFHAKRDQDGKTEPSLCFLDREYNRLMWMNEEEVNEFEKLAARIESYYALWESKKNTDVEAWRHSLLFRVHSTVGTD
ncbi:hypothetical protein IE077_001533 [Cardiosporidium cionae]|uniref:Uncharacterized protein n=1 Tax=Cardiosporidium cionae TaxID=476202 RepID=A0ABQ7J649_9APIC|nr:hypothetical protein IE077_001533 [Cardiosporidium cionae]|eukprot:KAF8819160.1 hypothetical protein IE077_001533 [Cardiosporidium cionae]